MSDLTIYVKLRGEGTNVWAPVTARYVDQDRYRIIQELSDDADPEFSQGQVVRCERRNLSGGEVLVAFEESKLE